MSTAPARQSSAARWIISPLADLALVIAAPLAIVPAIYFATHYVAPELIFAVVASFASLGHHLPGFIRAYGDRELFQRFRYRFLLAPPLFMAVAAAFSIYQLHGLELLLLFWATWHVLMQTYGLMRIYDLKRGAADGWSARLDFIACLAVFACGIVFSQSRVYTLLEIAARVGVPLGSPTVLTVFQWTLGISTAAFLLVYCARIVWQLRGRGPSWAKISLLLSTGCLYWICGLLSTNILIGVAMFEIFHALQYYAIVWSYNRRLADRAGEKFGPLRYMFGRGWLPLGIYMAAIAAFGSLRWLTHALDASAIKASLLTLLVASVGLHFYYDGFIWKVRERDTSLNLDIHAAGGRRATVSPWLHSVKWAVLAGLVIGLFAVEYAGRNAVRADDERQLVAALRRWTPDVPELLVRDSHWSLSQGETTAAVAAAQRAVQLRPRWPEAQAALGSATLKAGQYEVASAALEQAIMLQPGMWENHFDYALALREQQRYGEADRQFAAAAQLDGQRSEIFAAWAENSARRGELPEAIEHDRQALALAPDSLPLRTYLVQRLIQANRGDEALQAAMAGLEQKKSEASCLLVSQAQLARRDFLAAAQAAEQALAINSRSVAANYSLGLARLQLGEYPAAEVRLRLAVSLNPRHALAYFQLGNVYYLTDRLALAEDSFRKSIALSPDAPDAHNNLGALLMAQDRLAAAKLAFQSALAASPNNASSNFNLGLISLAEQDLPQARKYLLKAQQHGQTLSAELKSAAGIE